VQLDPDQRVRTQLGQCPAPEKAGFDLKARRPGERLEALPTVRRVVPDEAHNAARLMDGTSGTTQHGTSLSHLVRTRRGEARLPGLAGE
jgi:hypothetical protein